MTYTYWLEIPNVKISAQQVKAAIDLNQPSFYASYVTPIAKRIPKKEGAFFDKYGTNLRVEKGGGISCWSRDDGSLICITTDAQIPNAILNQIQTLLSANVLASESL